MMILRPVRPASPWGPPMMNLPDRPQDHHRHLRRLGRPRRWRVLREGPHQGGPLCGVRLPADGQVRGEQRALVQLSYATGVAKPLSLFLETYGTEQGALSAEDITNVLKMEFDCRPGAIAMSLALREPKYQETAAYC